LEKDEQFKMARKLHIRSPLALERLCLNFLEDTWIRWVFACNNLQQNLFVNIRKYLKGALNYKIATVLNIENTKTYKSIPHKAWFRLDPQCDLATLKKVVLKGCRIPAEFGVVLWVYFASEHKSEVESTVA